MAHFHCLCMFPDYSPFLIFLGLTQEGVYRTVGSNIEVQKLLNAFFGKEGLWTTSVHPLCFLARASLSFWPAYTGPQHMKFFLFLKNKVHNMKCFTCSGKPADNYHTVSHREFLNKPLAFSIITLILSSKCFHWRKLLKYYCIIPVQQHSRQVRDQRADEQSRAFSPSADCGHENSKYE